MFEFLNTKMEFFGLDVSDTSIKVARVKKKGKNIDLVSWGKLRLEQGVVVGGKVKDKDLLASAIKDLTKNKRLGKYVATSLPEEKSFFHTIEIPQMDKKQIKETVEYEAESFIPLPIDDVYLDFQLLSSKGDSLKVLLVALPKKIIDPQIASLTKGNLFPVVAEVESVSTVRSIVSKEDKAKSLLLIDIGERKTSIIVFSEGVVKFSSYILFSSGEFTQKIADFYEISEEEAEKIKKEHGLEKEEVRMVLEPLLNEAVSIIKKHLSYYDSYGFIPQEMEKIITCGGGSNLRGLTGFLSEKLSLPVEKGDPFVNLSKRSRDMFEEEGLNYGVAFGLALRNFS